MMRVLVYGHRKQSDEIYDISTPEKEEAVFRTLFQKMDQDWNVYHRLKQVPALCAACAMGSHQSCTDNDKVLHHDCACVEKECPSNRPHNDKVLRRKWAGYYKKAKSGDYKHMKMLMAERCDLLYEYETFRLALVRDATAN
jgi:hypothetical protein